MKIENYSPDAQQAIERAQQLLEEQQQKVLHPAHLLCALLESPNTLLQFIFRQADVDQEALFLQAQKLSQSYPQVDPQRHYFSSYVNTLFQKAERLAQELALPYVDQAHLLWAMLMVEEEAAQLLKKQKLAAHQVKKTIKDFAESQNQPPTHTSSQQNQKLLEKYAINLNELAQKGEIDPVIGRDSEIRQVIEILSRRTKNNPVLIGEPGVGKTAIAEGLAQQIIEKNVPDNMLDKTILRLDLTSLVAGTKYQGEFEDRLKKIIKALHTFQKKIILFIDEIHTLIGTGSSGKSAMDAANILKPALARGQMRMIGATTLNEYQEHIEKDAAFERRLQPVKVLAPTIPATITILRGLKAKYEAFHGVRITDDALIMAARSAKRYITARHLPDSAIDIIDQACARQRISLSSMPPSLSDMKREIKELTIEKEAMRKEKKQAQTEKLQQTLQKKQAQYDKLVQQWESEKKLVLDLKQTQKVVEKLQQAADEAEREADYAMVAEIRYGKIPTAQKKIEALTAAMHTKGKKSHFLKEEVDQDAILEVLTDLTGIPMQTLAQTDKERLLSLEKKLNATIIGQEEATQAVANAVLTSRAGINNPNRPIGSFIFLGTTGVGKTALSQTLAESLFNDRQSLIRIDLSEYQEKHSLSRLIGAPPGYVGYEQGGQLTEAVRRQPHAVILFDEMEKAHPDLFNLLLPILDEGHLTDSKGRIVNFKNTIIIMTSNLGSEHIQKSLQDATPQNQSAKRKTLQKEMIALLKKRVRPEFINRIDYTLIFNPLTPPMIEKIATQKLATLQERLREKNIKLAPTPAYKAYLADQGYDPHFGARPLERLLQELLHRIAKGLIAETFQPGQTLTVDHNAQGIQVDPTNT